MSGDRTPIVVGNVGTYSGVVGASLGGAQETFYMWLKAVNASGGIAGHPVRGVSADDNGDPARNLTLVKDMVENRGAIAFVGNQVPLSVGGSQAYLEQHKIPAVGGDIATTNWNNSPMLFPQGTGLTHLISALNKIAVQQGKPKIAMIYCAEAATCSFQHDYEFAKGNIKADGGDPVYSEQASLATPDFTGECLNARRAGAQTIYAAGDATYVSRIANACVRQNYRPLFMTLSIAVVSSLRQNPNLDGLLAPQITFPWPFAGSPAAKEFASAIKRFAPDLDVSGSASAVWVAGKLFEKAVSMGVGNGPPTSAKILDGLYQLKNETLGGLAPPLTFVRGKPAPEAKCYFVVGLKGGQWDAPRGGEPVC